MATEPVLAAFQLTALQRCHSVRSRALSDYWELTKPEVNFLIAMTTVAAFCLGSPKPLAHFPWLLLLHTLFGTVLVASGAGTLNQLIERKFDAQMRRTSRRPIAAGRVEPVHALFFGTLLSLTGVLYLALAVRPAASLLALLTLCAYLFFYTPIKRRTPWCTLVGAFPGAMPVLIGYVAATGKLDSEAWQLPGSPNRNRENTINGMAERASRARLSVGRFCANGFAACQSGVRDRNTAVQFRLPLFCSATRLNSLKPICAPAAFGLDPLSPIGVLACSAGKSLRK